MACVLPCFGQSLCLSRILVFPSLCVYKYIRLGCNHLCINPFSQPCSFWEHVKQQFGQILVRDCLVIDSEPRKGNAPLTMSLCARASCNGPPGGNVWPLCCQSIPGRRRPGSGKVTGGSYSSETFSLPSFFSLQIQYWVSEPATTKQHGLGLAWRRFLVSKKGSKKQRCTGWTCKSALLGVTG